MAHSYKTLEVLSEDLAAAVTGTNGLNTFKFDDMEALNADHNISYPLCMVMPPDSSIPNINRAREEYNMTVYILDVTTSSDTRAQEYDKALRLYTEWMSNLMHQREGSYILGQEIEIDRVRNIGNDKTIGVKISFSILAPSVLIDTNPEDLTPVNLYQNTPNYVWVNYGSNTVENISGEIIINYVSDSLGAFTYLSESGDLSENLVLGALYSLSMDVKANLEGFRIQYFDGALSHFRDITSTYTSITISFSSSDELYSYVRIRDMVAGGIVNVKNISVIKLHED